MSTRKPVYADPELEAMRVVVERLTPLAPGARARVMRWLIARTEDEARVNYEAVDPHEDDVEAGA